MLEGITILNESTKIASNGSACIFGGICLIIFFGALLGFLIQDSIEDKKVTIGKMLGILICIAILIGAGYLIYSGITWREVVYEVLISDDVSPTQLLEQFEIRDKEGLIYKIVPYPTN